jgi:hypoxanthine phosphoribosyltransferase
VRWRYEPRAFAVEWDEAGRPMRYFRPDFYLPDEDLFIEITTMNQKLVTKKNRKVKLLRELYPNIRCKIFYQRDYLHLLVKYGLAESGAEDPPAAPTRIPGPLDVTNLAFDAEASAG